MSYFEDYDLEACTRVDAHGIRWMKHGLSNLDFLRTRWRLRRTHPSAKTYLINHVEDFPWGKFLRDCGTEHRSGSYRLFMELWKRKCFMPEGHCYQNALAYSLRWEQEQPDWMTGPPMYVEGLYVDPEGVFPHAWVEAGGKVYEPTLWTGYMATYYGISITPSVADNLCRDIGKYGLLPNWEKSEPLLTKLFAEAA